jgi:hypothetical protein
MSTAGQRSTAGNPWRNDRLDLSAEFLISMPAVVSLRRGHRGPAKVVTAAPAGGKYYCSLRCSWAEAAEA